MARSQAETMTSQHLPALLTQPTAQAQARWEKWIQQEIVKGKSMVSSAKTEEDNGRNLPRAIRELEYCPAATRNQEILLCGWLAIKTSGGWTRRWQARYCVLTTQFLYIFKRAPPATSKRMNALGPQITPEQSAQVIDQKYALESSHDLFGEFRDSVPMDGSASIIKILDLPNTFQISYPSRPRLLLRAATANDADKWCNSVYMATALASYKISQLSALSKEYTPMVPHINDIIQGYLDKATIIRAVFLSPYAETDKKTNLHIPTLVSAQNVDYLLPVHIPLVPPYTKKNCKLTILFGDGGKVNIPLDTLFSRTLSPDCAPTAHGACAGYYDGLFTIAYANYNADVHLAWRFDERTVDKEYFTSDLGKSEGGKGIDMDICRRAALHRAVNPAANGGSGSGSGSVASTPAYVPQTALATPSLSALPSPALSSTSLSLPSPSPSSPSLPLSSLSSLSSALPPNIDTALFVASGILIASLPGVVTLSSPQGVFTLLLCYVFAIAAIYVALKSKEYVKKSDVEAILTAANINATGNTTVTTHNSNNVAHGTNVSQQRSAASAVVSPSISTHPSPLMSSLSPVATMLTPHTTTNTTTTTTTISITPPSPATAVTIPVLSLQAIRYVNRHSPSTTLLLAGEPLSKDSNYPSLPNFTIATPFVEGIGGDFLSDDAVGMKSVNEMDGNRLKRAFSVIDPNQLVSFDDDLHPSDNETDNDNGYGENDGDNDNDDDMDKVEVETGDRYYVLVDANGEKKHIEKTEVVEAREIVNSDPFIGNVYKEKWGCWSQSDYRPLLLRGNNYFQDKKKIPATPLKFPLSHCEIVAVKQAKEHCANWKNSFFKRQLARATKLGRGDDWAPGTPLKYVVINYLVPGAKQVNFFIYLKNTYIWPSPFPEDIVENVQQQYHPSSPGKIAAIYPENDPFFPLMQRFIASTDEERTKRFKFIPNVAEGNWIVKKGVGNTPALIAKKISTKYHMDPNGQYAEIDIDVSTSSMAGRVLGLVKGYAKSIHIDQFFTIEPQDTNELPEGLWGAVRLHNVDLDAVDTVEVEEDN